MFVFNLHIHRERCSNTPQQCFESDQKSGKKNKQSGFYARTMSLNYTFGNKRQSYTLLMSKFSTISAVSSNILGVPVFRLAQQGEKPLRSWGVWRLQWGVLHSEQLKARGSARLICLFVDELIFTLLRVWGSEFGIPNWQIGFKIALDAALTIVFS